MRFAMFMGAIASCSGDMAQIKALTQSLNGISELPAAGSIQVKASVSNPALAACSSSEITARSACLRAIKITGFSDCDLYGMLDLEAACTPSCADVKGVCEAKEEFAQARSDCKLPLSNIAKLEDRECSVSTAVIIGATVGGIVLLGAVVGGVIVMKRRSAAAKNERALTPQV
jgi:hypothetical protein